MLDISKRPPWVVIGTYRIVPLPIRPIPPYHKPTKWPPSYLSKRAPIKVPRDAANPNSSPDGAR